MTTARPAKTRDEGQWALGNREPLNANEEFKQAGPPLEVRDRIENVYAKEGFDSIELNDLRGRMRWWRGVISISSVSAAVAVCLDVVDPAHLYVQLAAGSAPPE